MMTGEKFDVLIRHNEVTVSFMCFDGVRDTGASGTHHKCKGTRITKDWQRVACECVCHG